MAKKGVPFILLLAALLASCTDLTDGTDPGSVYCIMAIAGPLGGLQSEGARLSTEVTSWIGGTKRGYFSYKPWDGAES
jgi:hypothetical protein